MRSPCQPSSILEASVATLTGFSHKSRWSQHSWLSGLHLAMAPAVGSSMHSTPPTTTRRGGASDCQATPGESIRGHILLMISSSSSWPSSLNWLYTSIENEHPSMDNQVPRWAQLPIVDLCAIWPILPYIWIYMWVFHFFKGKWNSIPDPSSFNSRSN